MGPTLAQLRRTQLKPDKDVLEGKFTAGRELRHQFPKRWGWGYPDEYIKRHRENLDGFEIPYCVCNHDWHALVAPQRVAASRAGNVDAGMIEPRRPNCTRSRWLVGTSAKYNPEIACLARASLRTKRKSEVVRLTCPTQCFQLEQSEHPTP